MYLLSLVVLGVVAWYGCSAERRPANPDKDYHLMPKNADLKIVRRLRPQHDGNYIMYWRPQKVGSSTLLSLLITYGFRHGFIPRRKSVANAFCARIAECAIVQRPIPLTQSQELRLNAVVKGKRTSKTVKDRDGRRQETLARTVPHMIVLNHELCNVNSTIVASNLKCAFDRSWIETNASQVVRPNDVSPFPDRKVIELFQVRDPVERAVSAYYFWGELYKLVQHTKGARSRSRSLPPQASAPETAIPRKRGKRIEEKVEPEEEKKTEGSMNNNNWQSGATNFFFGKSKKQNRVRKIIRPPQQNEFEQQRRLRAEHNGKTHMLGDVDNERPVQGSLFNYHGSEHTVPSLSYAMEYVSHLPYSPGMPGPSFTWSAFANSVSSAVDRVHPVWMEAYQHSASSQNVVSTNGNRSEFLSHVLLWREIARMQPPEESFAPVFTIVLERLEESLVVLRHVIGMSMADVVHIKARKSLSSHPKATSWPSESIDILREKLKESGEYRVYSASNQALDFYIKVLQTRLHRNVSAEVQLLRDLRDVAKDRCLTNTSNLEAYKSAIRAFGLPVHPSENKLRDVEAQYSDNGHLFSFNREILGSFDLCASCESESILIGWEASRDSVHKAPFLSELSGDMRHVHHRRLMHCPVWNSADSIQLQV